MHATAQHLTLGIFIKIRYILACGAGENSATKERIQLIFNQYGGNAETFNFDAFVGFYEEAAASERAEHVWNDLWVHKFDAVTIWSQMNGHKPPDAEYAVILENFLRAMAFESDDFAYKLAKVFFAKVNDRNRFPRSEFARQMMCDGEWRRNFLRTDGWNVLLKIIFRIPKWKEIQPNRRQVFKDMLESICRGGLGSIVTKQSENDPLGISIGNVDEQYEESAEFEEIEDDVLIHSICINAKIGIMGKRIDFLDEIPRKIVSAHSNVLIVGYIRMNVDMESIPDDVLNLLLLFF